MNPSIGDDFQKETKFLRNKLKGGFLDWKSKPETYKFYPSAPKIPLPDPISTGGRSLWDVIGARRSLRSFSSRPLELSLLSQLLWACQGITARIHGYEMRTAPSAGALYPIETYLCLFSVTGLEPGVYHYGIQKHELEQVKTGNFREAGAAAALNQRLVASAPAVFIWTAVFPRSKWKYGQRAYRYVYLDAGHIAQNLALAAVSLGMGTCQIAALYDDEVNEILGVKGKDESVVYMSVVGHHP
ncbi:MAG: SagB/ThcOx family dehydrogenase [Candidatus Aminicenantes bacterium]|nr:SagB/ThcOx family dehydrogenase [Candidatus Aminicenantes bacterium]